MTAETLEIRRKRLVHHGHSTGSISGSDCFRSKDADCASVVLLEGQGLIGFVDGLF